MYGASYLVRYAIPKVAEVKVAEAKVEEAKVAEVTSPLLNWWHVEKHPFQLAKLSTAQTQG